MPRTGRFTPKGRDPVPVVQEAEWAPGPVWKGAENLAPARNRCPDRPVRSESLYRLFMGCLRTDYVGLYIPYADLGGRVV
jgi:hypothetical protein